MSVENITGISVAVTIGLFLAINMGASGFSVSFAPSYGSGVIERYKAVFLYAIFVTLGAVTVGPRVVETLTDKLVTDLAEKGSGILILSSAALTMFVANILKVPQSTSLVIVASFAGSGLFWGGVNTGKLIEIISIALLLSLAAFGTTYFFMKKVYPPNDTNLRWYETIEQNRGKIRRFVLYTDCYSAFAIGTNNVANVVAPLMVSGVSQQSMELLLLVAPFFGAGGLLLGKDVINTISKNIVPLGDFTAAVVSLVTSTFVILASFAGIPTPYVQFTTFAVLAVCARKDGMKATVKNATVKRIFLVWVVVPFVAVAVSYVLHTLMSG